jgi:hypothetical protein
MVFGNITEVMEPGSTRTLSKAETTAAIRILANSMKASDNRNDKKSLTTTGRQQQQGHQKLPEFRPVKT